MWERYDTPPESGCLHQLWPQGLWGGIEKIDDYTVKVKLNYTFSGSKLSFTDVMIIPDELYAERGEDLFSDQTETGYTGTGPWIMTSHVQGQSVSYKKNENYWNPNVDSYYDEIEIRFITEQTTAVASLINGDIQMYVPAGGISPDLLPQLDGSKDKLQVFNSNMTTFYYLQFDCHEGEAFADEKVRQAFQMSIDYKAIVDNILGGGTVMNQLSPVGAPGYNADLPEYEFDPDAAKKLLEESSYDGRKIDFIVQNNLHLAEDQVLAICDYASAVGFNMNPEIIENASLSERRIAGKMLLARVGRDEHNTGFKDAELTDILSKASGSTDDETYVKALSDAQKRMRDVYGPMYGLYYADSYVAVSYGITGIEFDPGGTYYFQFIDFNEEDPTSADYALDWDSLFEGL